MRVEYGEHARRQIRHIARYYGGESRDLGLGFLMEIDRAVLILTANPRIGSPLGGKQRKLLLKKFPYLLVYEIDDRNNRVLVNCISHQARHPENWRNRAEEPASVYRVLLAA